MILGLRRWIILGPKISPNRETETSLGIHNSGQARVRRSGRWIFWMGCYENDSKNEVAMVCQRDYHRSLSSAGNLNWICHLYRPNWAEIPLGVERLNI
jgi:hypothetical protein